MVTWFELILGIPPTYLGPGASWRVLVVKPPYILHVFKLVLVLFKH